MREREREGRDLLGDGGEMVADVEGFFLGAERGDEEEEEEEEKREEDEEGVEDWR